MTTRYRERRTQRIPDSLAWAADRRAGVLAALAALAERLADDAAP